VSGRFLISTHEIDPVSLSVIRFFIGSLCLFAIGFFLLKKRMLVMEFKDVPYLFLISALGITGMSLFLFIGQKHTTATNSSLIMQLNPFFIMVLSVFIGEKISRRKVAGLILSFIGCLFVIEILTVNGLSITSTNNEGDIFILLSALCWAIYSILSKNIVKKYGSFKTMAWVMFFGFLELTFIYLVMPFNTMLPTHGISWVLIIYLGIFPTAIAFFAWFEALNTISLSLLNIMQYITPFFTILLSCIFLKEQLKANHYMGILIIACGIFISEYKVKRLNINMGR